MTKQIEDYTADELSAKIEAIKAERERTANALKRYEEELERRKQGVLLGVPINTGSKELFCVSGVNTILSVKEKFSLIAELSDALNLFHSKESAEKHAEMLLDWRKALVSNSKGEPIDIQVLLPLLKKGWVAMDKDGDWYWYEKKPRISSTSWYLVNFCYRILYGFNIKPAENWMDSLQECGLCMY